MFVPGATFTGEPLIHWPTVIGSAGSPMLAADATEAASSSPAAERRSVFIGVKRFNQAGASVNSRAGKTTRLSRVGGGSLLKIYAAFAAVRRPRGKLN